MLRPDVDDRYLLRSGPRETTDPPNGPATLGLESLVRHVGEERFRRASEYARAIAAGESRMTAPAVSDADAAAVPHELAGLVKGDLGLAMALFRVMPCYSNLMYIGLWAPRHELFGRLRPVLDESDRTIADPVLHWLWCGPFEAVEQRSAAAWRATSAAPTERRLTRLLEVSGPVPWSAKAPVLEALAGDPRWHGSVWTAIEGAVFDPLGRVDLHAAERLLARMAIPRANVDGEHEGRRLGPCSEWFQRRQV